jgi:lantibiotic modifying enzyme
MGRLVVQPNDEFNSWSRQKDEASQMQQLDIPYFEHHVDSTTVTLTGEKEMVSDLIKISGMVSAVKRLELLKKKEIEAQERFLIGTIKARSLEHQAARTLYLASGSNECDSRVSGGRTTNAIETCDAMQLYKDVWNEAICDEKGRPEWLGVDAMGNCESFQYGLLGDSLFSGITGIALAMARITLDNEDPQTGIWKDRARACIDKFSSQIEQRRGEKYKYFVDGMPVGMLGKGGILLALGLLSQAGIGESEQVVDTLVERIKPDDIRSDVCLDLLGGIAGLIGPMLLLGTERCMELAIICGERLLELQHENGSWETVDMPTRITAKDLLGPCPLAEGGRLLKKDSSGTNFCSGSSGIAAGLSRLRNSTVHEPFTAGALRAVEYERKHNSIKSIKDMKDKASDDEDCWVKWGEGASGVALSRLVLQSVGLGNEDIGIELDQSRRELKEQLKRSLKRTGFNNGLGWGAVGHASVLGLEMGLNQQRCHKDEEVCFASLRANKDNIVNSQDKDMSMLHGLFTGRAGTAFLLFEASTEMRWLPQIMTAGLYKSA